MTFEEYVAAQKLIIASLVARLLDILIPFRSSALGPGQWIVVLSTMYPHVEEARRESAVLARDFYDSERVRVLPGERHDFFLANYQPDWFQESMEHTREDFEKPGASEGDLVRVIESAVTQTENAGRKTLLRAVETDPKVKGWARVATGEETCSWCLMLVSRGPIYKSAKSAGLNLKKKKALELTRQIENAATPEEAASTQEVLDGFMDRWHDNCDCKVVPVFDKKNWVGRDAWKQAEAIWKKATKGYSGQDAVNAFRRAVERGDLEEIIKSITSLAA